MLDPTVHNTAQQNTAVSWSFPLSNSNGKEKDHESGFHYFGARYYWSELLTGWLSVDPMMDKYPGISPYSYCAWNPVKLVDPDGNEAIANDDGWKVDRNNKTITRVSSDGGDAFQYINENDVWRSLIGTQSDVLGQYVDFTLIDNVRNGAQLIQEESKNNLSDDLPSTVAGVTSGYIGYGCNRMAKVIFDYDNGTYMGKDGSTKVIQKGKNGGLNGRYKNQQKLAANYSRVATGFKWLGRGSAVYSAVNTEVRAHRGEITNQERWTNHIVNAVSSLPYCWHVPLFYELGKNYGPSTWF